MNSSNSAGPLGSLAVRQLVVLAAAALASASCQQAAPAPAPPVSADTWAVVDSRAITRDQVEKAYRRTQDASQALSDDEALTAKINLLNEVALCKFLLRGDIIE
jgi:hypothetical protein